MNPVTRRIRILVLALLLLHAVVLVRVFAMQVFMSSRFIDEAERQTHRTRRLVPRRGPILDRAGRVLASEEPGYHVLPWIGRRDSRVWRCGRCLRTVTLGARTLPRKCRGCGAPGERFDELTVPRPERYAGIARHVDLTPEEIEDLIERTLTRYEERKERGSLRGPDPVLQDVPLELAREMHLHPERTPGLRIVGARLRYNHHPAVMPHLVGSAGLARERDPERLAPLGFRLFDVYRMTVGHSGLEKILDERLVGRMGIQEVVVDHAGIVVHTSRDDEPVPGDTVRLTIDLELQREAERALDGCGYSGAFVAIDPSTGEILAMATAPRYDIATLGKEYERLAADPAKPFQNRATSTPATPGSVFKVVTALAGLEAGTIDPRHTVHCTGAFVRPGLSIGCNGVHGDVDLLEALERSCNVYFIEAGIAMGALALEKTCLLLGLGAPTGLQVAEASGSIPSEERCRGFALAMVSFGQGRVATTPVQMARVAATIANGGRLVHPSLIVGERPRPGPPLFDRANLDLVRDGMYAVVHGRRGTAHRVGLTTFSAAAKTGTAERTTAEGGLNNAWLIGYAPHHDPTVAFACYVEMTPGHGGKVCGPVVARWLAAWKRWRDGGGR